MLNKLTSSVMAATAFAVMVVTPSNPSSMLFIFISNNKFIATARLVVALIMVAISFEFVRFGANARRPLLFSGLAFIAAGFVSVFVSPVLYGLYDYVKIMDILIAMELGVLLCTTALGPAAVKVRKSQAKKSLKPQVALRQA
jgi:hypothetical protein